MMNRKETSQLSRQRRRDIDLLRGIGIALMVIGHFKLNYEVEKVMYAFHMPLFFIVSGYLYRKPESFKLFALKKMRGFLVPYFTFGVGLLLFKLLIMGNKMERLQDSLQALFWTPTMDVSLARSLWFLLAMLWCVLVYAWVDLHCREPIKTLLIIVLTGIFCLWKRWFPVLPWAICSGLSALGFYHIGSLYRRYEMRIKERLQGITRRRWLLVALIAGVILMIFVDYHLVMMNAQLSLRKVRFGYIPLAYFNAVYLTMVVYLLTVLCDRYSVLLAGVLTFFGKHSIAYLGLNELFIKISGELVEPIISAVCPPATLLVAYVFVMTMMSLCAWFVSITPLKKLLG